MTHSVRSFALTSSASRSKEATPSVHTVANGRAGFSDPAFAGNKTLPLHRWVPWIAGFSSSFVGDILKRYLHVKGLVLDPFCGVGTTLVEAMLQGHDTVGFEINPYAALASKIKSTAGRVSVSALQEEISCFKAFYFKRVDSDHQPISTPPQGFRGRTAFYSPKVLRKVLIVQDFLASIDLPEIRDLFRLAFASTMVQYSNYSYEPSLGRRVSAGKAEIIDYPVGDAILGKLGAMSEDIQWMQERLAGKKPTCCVYEDSFFRYDAFIESSIADLIITSPPYLNNYHYNRNTRPQLYWLGFVSRPKDLAPLEQANFGKFWQTVRGQAHLGLEFELPASDLHEKLEELRRLKPEKGVYGGNGWANYAAAYFNDCWRFAEGINYALKPGGRAFVVIGNSILQGLVIETDRYFGQIAESVGLELVQIDIPRTKRVGNSIIQSGVRVSKAKDSDRLYESIVELKKQ